MFIMSFPWALLVAGLIFVAVFATGIVVGLIVARSSYKPFLNMMIYNQCAEMSDISKWLDELNEPSCKNYNQNPDELTDSD